MAVIDWPASYLPQTAQIALQRSVRQFRSPHNGSLQAVGYMAERWQLSFVLPPRPIGAGGAIEALLFQLTGGVDRVRCWHFGRPQPAGTLRGSPVVATGAVRGDTTLAITTTAGATVKAGDMLAVALAAGGTQLIQMAADGMANGSGALTLALVTHIRNTVNVGAAITWNRPTAEFVMPASRAAASYRPGVQEGAVFELDEAY